MFSSFTARPITTPAYNSLPSSLPTLAACPNHSTPLNTFSAHHFTNMNKGTGGSFARVRWSWRSRETIEMKEAMLKTEIERDVSFRIERRGCVRW